MVDHWSILGLEEPTQDVSSIRRAYAVKTRECHPEEDPEGFLRLREAYQAALAYAERGACPPPPAPAASAGEEDWGPDEDGEAERPGFQGWVIPEQEQEDRPDPYADSEAIRKFEELYTKKQRKDPKLWMDYFTSNIFLDVAWEPEFTQLMLEKVTQVERELPPGKEFLTWLYIAYQFSAVEKSVLDREAMRVEKYPREVTLGPGADFEGMESILRIAAKGAIPKAPRGNEFAIGQSFADHRHLARLAKGGAWSEQAVTEFKYVVRRYVSAYIKERCEQRVASDLERHPAGLRVFTHFFKAYQIPEELYRHVWQDLGLKMAIMGRAKVLYGDLREIVAERVPGIDGEIQENFLQLNRALDSYLARIKGAPEREEEESAAFFAREDLQKALRSPRFIEKELLTYSKWRRDEIGSGLLRRILDFYRAHPEVSGADRVVEEVGKDLDRRAVKLRDEEDAKAEGVAYYERLTLAYRPFFRHWLNTAWFDGVDLDGGTYLLDHLRERLPYQVEWSRRFLQKEDGTIRSRTVAACMGEVEVDFHLRHMEFRVKGSPVYRPCLAWEQTVIEGGDWFFYLLPITAASYEQYDEVHMEILRRLPITAAPEEDRGLISECLACAVCSLPLDEYTGKAIPPEEALPLKRYVEDRDRLYGCVWREENRLVTLFEQTTDGQRVRRRYELAAGEDAAEAAQRLLREAVSHSDFDLHLMKGLPLEVYVLPPDGPEYVLKQEGVREMEAEMDLHWPELDRGELVTMEALMELLAWFEKGELRRLELHWCEGSLVFCRWSVGYACFYFEQSLTHHTWYAMLSKPEVYRVVESDDVVYVPFGMGTLPDYVIHDSPASILKNLDRVFWQLCQGRPQAQGAGGWLWDSNTSQMNGEHKRHMAQQKVGGFPPHRGRNRLAARFVMNKYPVELEQVGLDGERTMTAIKSGSYGRAADALSQFMKEKLGRLRLSWEFKTPEGGAFRRHLVLLQDDGRFMMAWLQDDKDRAQYHIAERSGEDDGTDVFLGRSVPARLVHHDLKGIRNCVDLILDDMDNTDPVTERPEGFETAQEPYEAVWADLVDGGE